MRLYGSTVSYTDLSCVSFWLMALARAPCLRPGCACRVCAVWAHGCTVRERVSTCTVLVSVRVIEL